MKRAGHIAALREAVSDWRRAGERIAFAPTMGNLHAGHLSLVERARELADRVVVSIFVNPLQFDRADDLARYPRTLEQDEAKLRAAHVDLLFLPNERQMYPAGRDAQTRVVVPELTDMLCGASRPGHFDGVATVVCKLFNLVWPDVALFGEKDYQQLAIIRRMVADLNLPVEVVGVPTMREASGLAMSSRNGYLSEEERRRAAVIHRTLKQCAAELETGDRDYPALVERMRQRIADAGLRPDYAEIRRPDLRPAGADDQRWVILVAAWLGKARLIDNLQVG